MTIETIKNCLDEVLPEWRKFSTIELHAMQIAIRALAARAGTYKPGFKNRKFVPGTRVCVKQTAVVYAGRKGIVQSIEVDASNQSKVWVLLDGTSHALFFMPRELKFDEEVSPDHQCITLENGDCINPYCDLHAPSST